MINGIVTLGIIVYILITVLLMVFKYTKHQKIVWQRELFKFLFVLYILMVISVTLFPITWGAFSWENIKYSINLIPFVSIIKDISSLGTAYGGDVAFSVGLMVRNVGGNILLLMPLGVLAPILWKRFQQFKKSVLLGSIVSVSIECIQFFETLFSSRGRTIDIDDVICNTVGVAIGYGIYLIVVTIANKLGILTLNRVIPLKKIEIEIGK